MDNIFILERLDRIVRLLSFQKEILTFDEACDYQVSPAAISISSQLHVKSRIPNRMGK